MRSFLFILVSVIFLSGCQQKYSLVITHSDTGKINWNYTYWSTDANLAFKAKKLAKNTKIISGEMDIMTRDAQKRGLEHCNKYGKKASEAIFKKGNIYWYSGGNDVEYSLHGEAIVTCN